MYRLQGKVRVLFFLVQLALLRGGSRIFFRRGCTRLLLYFNTNKPHSFFFCRIPVVLENRRSSREGGGRTPCTFPLDPPLTTVVLLSMQPQHSSTAHNTDNNITCITLQCTRSDYRNDAIAISTCSSFTTSLEDTYEHICRHSPGVTPSGKDNQIHPFGSDTLCQWNSCASFLCIHWCLSKIVSENKIYR